MVQEEAPPLEAVRVVALEHNSTLSNFHLSRHFLGSYIGFLAK